MKLCLRVSVQLLKRVFFNSLAPAMSRKSDLHIATPTSTNKHNKTQEYI